MSVKYSTGFKSDRGLDLITKSCNLPMLTVEDYLKWYNIFKVYPNGNVETISWSSEILQEGWRDHCIEPKAFHNLAKSLGLGYDHETMAAVCKMFVTDALEGDWTKLHEYLPTESDPYDMDEYER